MRKLLILLGALLVSTQAFATYYVVLKDGSQIRARAKWTIVGGKAIVPLESGGMMTLDPNVIDVAKSEETTKMGGASVHLRRLFGLRDIDHILIYGHHHADYPRSECDRRREVRRDDEDGRRVRAGCRADFDHSKIAAVDSRLRIQTAQVAGRGWDCAADRTSNRNGVPSRPRRTAPEQ